MTECFKAYIEQTSLKTKGYGRIRRNEKEGESWLISYNKGKIKK